MYMDIDIDISSPPNSTSPTFPFFFSFFFFSWMMRIEMYILPQINYISGIIDVYEGVNLIFFFLTTSVDVTGMRAEVQ